MDELVELIITPIVEPMFELAGEIANAALFAVIGGLRVNKFSLIEPTLGYYLMDDIGEPHSDKPTLSAVGEPTVSDQPDRQRDLEWVPEFLLEGGAETTIDAMRFLGRTTILMIRALLHHF